MKMLQRQPIASIEEASKQFVELASLRIESASRSKASLNSISSCDEETLAQFKEEMLSLSSSPIALEVREWLKREGTYPTSQTTTNNFNSKGNVYRNPFTNNFFRNMHLRNRDPLPFGQNYSVVLSPIERDSDETPISQAVCLVIATLQFWKTIYQAFVTNTEESRSALRIFLNGIENDGCHSQRVSLLPRFRS